MKEGKMINDTIYREDAINVVEKNSYYIGGRGAKLKIAIAEIKALPSADRLQGEWIIEIDANGNTYGRCSICGMRQYAGQLNYCPDCGSRMKELINE